MISNNNYRIPIYAYILAFISIGIMTIILVIATILNIKICRKNERSRVNNIIETNLIFENLEVELYFKDRENILSFLSYDCIVNTEKYPGFEGRIIWTGGKYNYTKIIESNGEYTLYDSRRTSSPFTYTIDFNRELSFGDSVYFKLETSVKDDNLSMIPIFSHTIRQQTHKFTMHLTVPENLIKNIKLNVYKDSARTINAPNDIHIATQKVGNLMQYSFSINNPTLLNNYCFEWEFK